MEAVFAHPTAHLAFDHLAAVINVLLGGNRTSGLKSIPTTSKAAFYPLFLISGWPRLRTGAELAIWRQPLRFCGLWQRRGGWMLSE